MSNQRSFTDEEHSEFVAAKRAKRMSSIDAMSPALRECVNEFGLSVVKTLVDLGVKEPRHIRHVVNRILDEFSPTRGAYSVQGVRTPLNSVEEATR